MSTDFFRKYLDLLNEASGQPPVDFTPTHFHKNNLGAKIPLMKTPDDKFWWMTSDPENPRAGKTIQPWIGNTENRSAWTGTGSVDGAYQNGETVDFPEGSTWRDFAEPSIDSDSNRSLQVASPLPKVKEIPHIDPGPLVAPNEKEAPLDPPGYRFSNDQALANLAAQIKDAKGAVSSFATPTGSKTDSLESLEILKQIKELVAKIAALPPISIASDEYKRSQRGEADGAKYTAILDSREALFKQIVDLASKAAEIRSRGDMSDVTAQQIKEISITAVNKIQEDAKYLRASADSTDGGTIPMIKSIIERAKAINLDPTVDTFESGPNTDKIMAIVRELKQLPPKDTRTAEEQQQVNTLLDELKAVMEDKFKNIPRTKGGAAPSGSASGVAAGSDSGARWAYVPGDGTSKDISGKKDSSGLPSLTGADAASKKTGKETVISGDSHCAQCGTPKSLHAPLKHEFISGDDVRPGSVGGSTPSSDRSTKPATDTLAADQARIDKMPAWDRSKNALVGAAPPAAKKPNKPSIDDTPTKSAPKKPSFVKEDINRLPVVDQMSAWKQLIEADPKVPALLRPGVTTNRVPTNPPAAGPSRFDSPEAIKAAVDRMTNARTPAPETPGFLRSAEDLIRRRASSRATPQPAPPPNLPPPASVPPESALGKIGRTTARGFDMVYQIYDAYKQIMKLDPNTMSRDQYRAAAYKIVARVANDYGLFWVGSILGGFTAGLFTANPLGAIGGFVAGGTGGLAASYLLGDSVGAITDSIVDSIYGIDSKSNAEQIKLNPQQIGELKQYIAEMEAWAAAGNKLDQGQQQDLDKAKAMAKAAGVTVAPTPAPVPSTQAAEKVPTPAPAVNPVAEITAELQSIVTDLDKINADQTPLPGETGKTEMAKISALIAKNEAITEKIAKLPSDLRAPPELVNAVNAVNKKIYLAQRSVLYRSLLQDTDPAVYAKHKAGADKLMAFEAEVNGLDVKDPDFQKKALALARQINQMIDSLPDVPEGDRGAYMVRQQSLTAARDVMQHKQKEYEDYRAKNPTPAPATGGPKEGDKSTSKNGRPIIFKNGRWEYAN